MNLFVAAAAVSLLLLLLMMIMMIMAFVSDTRIVNANLIGS